MTADEFRQLALAFTGAVEGSHMGHPDFGGKIFATLGPDLTWGMARLDPVQQADLMSSYPGVIKPAAGKWGESGSTLVLLDQATIEIAGEALTLAWQNQQ